VAPPSRDGHFTVEFVQSWSRETRPATKRPSLIWKRISFGVKSLLIEYPAGDFHTSWVVGHRSPIDLSMQWVTDGHLDRWTSTLATPVSKERTHWYFN